MSIQLGEAKRRYERHFVSKLTDADAEQMETQHWVDEACDCQYLDSKQAEELTEELMQIGRMLNSMMDKANLFCAQSNDVMREEAVESWGPESLPVLSNAQRGLRHPQGSPERRTARGCDAVRAVRFGGV